MDKILVWTPSGYRMGGNLEINDLVRIGNICGYVKNVNPLEVASLTEDQFKQAQQIFLDRVAETLNNKHMSFTKAWKTASALVDDSMGRSKKRVTYEQRLRSSLPYRMRISSMLLRFILGGDWAKRGGRVVFKG